MVDANARINVDVNIAEALGKLRSLERQIQLFNKSIVQGTATAKKFQDEYSSSLIHNINATGKFTASMGKIHTETEKFTNALEKNKLTAREYFRYSMASTKTFGKMFGKEFGTITRTAEERVKQLQARHIELGRAADGAMRSVKIVPKTLDYSKPITQLQIAAQKQQIFNKLLDSGTTKLLNFGKNTQWAGRQLMVGFTIPLSILGSTALRTFKDMETQAIRFKKVYGDMFTATGETDKALANIKNLANEFTRYGISVADTIKLAADAAAAGNAGQQLESVVTQATKLSVLGGVAQEQALDATIAIQNAFGSTGKALDDSINFLNAVENQTIVALDDITEAIPKVAPVITQLGGDIKDLAFFMAAMQEGGVRASEAANALKSGLASLINPTKAASEMAAQLGINLTGIVEQNAGDLRMTVLSFAQALQPLEDLQKARLIEQIFGKYQFARISTLFNNVAKSGTQASRVLDLANESTEALAMTAERELGVTADSAAVKFQASVEKLKAALVPLGEQFAKIITPVADFLTRLLEKFNNLSDTSKTVITAIIAGIGGIGPVVLMSIGLIANGIANIAKFVNLLRKAYTSLAVGGQELGLSTNYVTQEELELLAVSNNLFGAHKNLTAQFALEASALTRLTTVYQQAAAAASRFATSSPGLFVPGTARALKVPKFGKPMADGGWVPGTGNKDTVPTVLMPGEFVVTKKAAQDNAQTLEAMNKGGQTYRTKGTPAFGSFVMRGGGSDAYKAPPVVRRQTERMTWATKDAEIKAMQKLGLTGGDLTSVQASHLGMGGSWNTKDAPKGFKFKEWKAKKLMADLGAINNYSNSLSNASETNKQFMFSDKVIKEAVRSTGKSEKKVLRVLRNLSLGMHPSTLDELKIMRTVADNHPNEGNLAKSKRQAKAVKAIADIRIKNPNFYETRSQRKYSEALDAEAQKYQKANRLLPLSKTDIKTNLVRRQKIQRVKRTSGKFGAALGLATVAGVFGTTAAQAFGRAGGTPAFGEQGITPAMLTPGEFVMNSQSAQLNGPALQAMNMGGVAFRNETTGVPGYKPKNASRMNPLNQPKFGSQMPAGDEAVKENTKAIKENAQVTKQNAQTVDDSTEQARKQLKRQEFSNKMQKASTIGFAVSGAALAYGMMGGEGKSAEVASNVANVGFAVSSLAMVLPMLTNPVVAVTAGIVGLLGAIVLFKKAQDNAAKEGMRIAKAMGTTADELEKVSQSTGKVSRSMLAERQREGRIKSYNPIKSEFGPGFIGTEAGKDLIKFAEQFEKQGIDSARVIANKLSSYVIDGLMTAADAESVAVELGRAIEDRVYGIEVLGNLQDLIGIDGRSLINHPIQIRVDLLEDVEATSQEYINTTQKNLKLFTEDDLTRKLRFLFPLLNPGTLKGFERGEFAKKRARDEGKGWFEQQLAGATANVLPGIERKKFAGAITGQQLIGLEMSQQMIDSAQIEYDTKKKQAQEEELLLQTRLKNTTDAKVRLDIEQKLLDVARKKAGIEDVYGQGVQRLVDIQKQMLTDSVVTFNQLDKTVQNELLQSSKTSLRDKFKGTLSAPDAERVIKLGEELSPDLNYKINLLVGSDQLDVGNAKRLLDAFQGDELALDARFELMVDKNGLESVNRTLTALSSIKDPDAVKNLFSEIGYLAAEDFDSANVFLENAMGIPVDFMDLNDNTVNLLSGKAMAEAGKDIKKIGDDLKDLDKLSKEDRQTKIIDFISDDADFAALQGQAEYFKSLDATNVRTFLTVFRSISEDYDPDEALKAFYAANPMTSAPAEGDLEAWWLRNVAIPRAKRFVEIMKEIKLPGLDEGDVAEGGGKSLPIATKQLIELRMKGLDPAAASQLDFDSAARILNGSVKQQREVIARLNTELRDAAIQAQLLKSDEEALGDVIDSTSSAIGSYIDMLEASSIQPIEDQIDKFNELNQTQQNQVEQYQRALQKLSDKEDSINDIYDARIDAIDAVSQANERAAQRQQRQIDLATALSSGDIAAAASAAADITSAESQIQLEDTRNELERQRQAELAALTIEINGQLFTREQIETNIKNLEDQIYDRNIKIREEQEKIAKIQKEITAEKEKQRKLDALSEILGISAQIRQTVDPTIRQNLAAQAGYIASSIGLEAGNQQSVDALTQSLGVNVQAVNDTLLNAQRISNQTAKEYLTEFEKAKKNAGDISRFFNEASIEADNSLKYLKSLSKIWAGDTKNAGVGGLAATGNEILNSLSIASNSIKVGRVKIDDAVNAGLASLRAEAERLKLTIGPGKKAFGGIIGYMGGGKVKRYAMGGNINYKGSNEPAPVRMAIGNIVPGLGNTDRVPALLTPGEFVVRKSVAQENLGLLKALNGDVFPQLNGASSMGSVAPVVMNNVGGDTNMYNNYSVNVNVSGSDASPNDIANIVVQKIRSINNRQIRSNRY